jgi:citrate synthase
MSKAMRLTAAEAAAILGVTPATLYAYVSRGLLRSEAGPEGSRTRLYARDEIEALKLRQMQRRQPRRMLEESLHWGAPILDTTISVVRDGRLYYRSHDAASLARNASLEEVAELLWADPPDPAHGNETAPRPPRRKPDPPPPGLAARIADLPPAQAFAVALAVASADDRGAWDLRATSVRRRGWRILDLLARVARHVQDAHAIAPRERKSGHASAAARDADPHPSVAARFQQAWCPRRPQALPLIQAALVLCAEHELNVSAFTARCAASAQATPYAVVAAALAACTGRRHGSATERVDALYEEALRTDPMSALEGCLRRGEDIPGFGHTLYPAGDPRASTLLEMLRERFPRSPGLLLTDALIKGAADLVDDRPTIDLALVALARTLALPAGAPFVIFSVARTVGWIAHAIEQYAEDRLIRPRARYREAGATSPGESRRGPLPRGGQEANGAI